jgi:hypothetical protein
MGATAFGKINLNQLDNETTGLINPSSWSVFHGMRSCHQAITTAFKTVTQICNEDPEVRLPTKRIDSIMNCCLSDSKKLPFFRVKVQAH